MQIERVPSDHLVVNQLPDGSRILVDPGKETLFALNATAGAAWEACSTPTTLSDVAASMQHTLGPEATEELAQEAVLQLQQQNLVKTSGAPADPSRRSFLTGLGAAAVPLVAALSMSEQKAFAQHANSGKGGKGGDGGHHHPWWPWWPW